MRRLYHMVMRAAGIRQTVPQQNGTGVKKMDRQNIDCMFHPESVAIGGVSLQEQRPRAGNYFLECLVRNNYKGRIYPVNPKGGKLLSGLEVFTSVMDIPAPVEYAICSVPRFHVIQFLKDCIVKGVKTVHIFTSGFTEIGDKEGKQLQEEISSLAHQHGIHIIGPNCLGIYCPQSGLSFGGDFPKESGPVAFLSQSGGFCSYLIPAMARRGIRFSKVVSYGNACDINESNLLEYFAADPETQVIAAYMEGVKDAQRFRRVLKEAAKAKPVIILKAGVGDAGARAGASHTGSLSGSDRVWHGLLHQAGAIRAHNLEELVDMVTTFTCLPVPSGRRAGVITIGGGAVVLAADDCTDAGLIVPRLPGEVQNRLENLLSLGRIGVGLSNPVDLSDQGWQVFYDCLNVMLDYDDIDVLIAQLPIRMFASPIREFLLPFVENLAADIVKINEESNKPIAAVIHYIISDEDQKVALNCERRLSEAGIPVYHSLGNAAKAIVRFLDYHNI
ncbi:acetate--CoA ligase family protein [Thermodesulfobacteriota bacterium]